MQLLKERGEDLHRRARELRKAGAVAQMTKGPALVEETGAFMVDMAEQVDAAMEAIACLIGMTEAAKERLDALTPYQDEGGAA